MVTVVCWYCLFPTFYFSDFSLASWLISQGISPTVSVIPSYKVDLLMEDLAINGYINDPQCDMSSTTGWDSSGIYSFFLFICNVKKRSYMKVKLFLKTNFFKLNLMKIILQVF